MVLNSSKTPPNLYLISLTVLLERKPERSAGKGVCWASLKIWVQFLGKYKGRRSGLVLQSCPLDSTSVLWHTYMDKSNSSTFFKRHNVNDFYHITIYHAFATYRIMVHQANDSRSQWKAALHVLCVLEKMNTQSGILGGQKFVMRYLQYSSYMRIKSSLHSCGMDINIHSWP